ncbi:hypothetical protein HanRHA438_Chr06g0248431 [Helianthus annuus]|nr:hypothetical protein HanIR_Chr06g0256961 [Helianthus annuus]KAJ0910079.1 hypothetical protein HanRHA438_Chr06g0248431 [Helianthus annuus]
MNRLSECDPYKLLIVFINYNVVCTICNTKVYSFFSVTKSVKQQLVTTLSISMNL